MRTRIYPIVFLSNRKCMKAAKERGVLVAEGQFLFQRLTSFEKRSLCLVFP